MMSRGIISPASFVPRRWIFFSAAALFQYGQKVFGDIPVDEKRFCGIARSGVLGLRVNDDGDGFCHVIIFVHIDVADTVGMSHDGDVSCGS